MTYRVRFAPAATRQLRKLERSAVRRVQAAIELLAQDPRPPGAKKLAGGTTEWRVRTGDYRIIYEIDDGVLLVLVLAVGNVTECEDHIVRIKARCNEDSTSIGAEKPHLQEWLEPGH